jgi:hypothetical protein
MTFREAVKSGKPFVWLHNNYGYLYYPISDTKTECVDILTDGYMGLVSTMSYSATLLDRDQPELMYVEDETFAHGIMAWVDIAPKKCDCDLYSVLLTSGCQCGGK